tara:strand:- start:419 stop:631 length:213 start_codon:yes stop_codon:yes gene_type:complete
MNSTALGDLSEDPHSYLPTILIKGGKMKRRLRRLLPRVKDSVSVQVLIYMNNLEWKLRFLINKKEKDDIN